MAYETFFTPEGSLSYPKVWEAVLADDAKPGDFKKWSTTILFKAEALQSAEWKKMVAAAMDQAVRALGAKPDAKVDFDSAGKSSILVEDGKRVARMPFRKNALGKYDEQFVMYINTNKTLNPNKTCYPPQIVDRDGTPLRDREKIYPGVRARLSVSCFHYKRADGWGVSFGLNNVQRLGDGIVIAGPPKATDEFGALDPEPAGAMPDDLGGLLG
jgi:hypothetical protein